MEKTDTQTESSCIKVVLFGPESSGKTTLAKALAAHYNAAWVPEYMRIYLQAKWDEKNEICTKEDLIPIARGQMQLENKISAKENDYVFCDTNLDELIVYSKYYYDGFCPELIINAAAPASYNLYLLTYIDTPWENDDLRDRPNDRLVLFSIFEKYLKDNNLPYVILKGTREERFQIAVKAIEHICK
jgi:HTH-type transcriptional repressor of NAD biosynthesis genes|tara:strand:- start:1094 stop:1654 length:561 start_codon:yes stop_codon:yes gene_type:complete